MSTWIFLRGLSRESRHWGAFPETFRQALPDAEVYALDLPGNGRRHGQESPIEVAGMAEFCRAELTRLGLSPPYHVLALSLGAMAAVAWAHRHPEEIAACVLVNTSLRPFSPLYRRLRPGCYLPLIKLLLLGGSPQEWENTILRLTSRMVRRPQETVEAWVGYRRECPVSSRNAWRQLLAAARYRAPLARPACPVLVLASARDALVHPDCSRRLAAQWQTGFAEHPAAGHDLPLDDGAWLAREVGAWLRHP